MFSLGARDPFRSWRINDVSREISLNAFVIVVTVVKKLEVIHFVPCLNDVFREISLNTFVIIATVVKKLEVKNVT